MAVVASKAPVRTRRLIFDAFSSREPVATPDRVRRRLSLENASLIRDFNIYITRVLGRLAERCWRRARRGRLFHPARSTTLSPARAEGGALRPRSKPGRAR